MTSQVVRAKLQKDWLEEKVAQKCDEGTIKMKKQYDEKGDWLYGEGWPLPLSFNQVRWMKVCAQNVEK